MTNCIFCKIISWEIPAQYVYEDDNFVAFHDIHPKAHTHILILPKQHIEMFHEVKDSSQKNIVKWLFDVAWELIKERELNWCNLLINSWSDHWQEVFHIHLHLMSNMYFK